MEKIRLDILGLFANKTQDITFTLLLGEVSGHRQLPIVIGMPEAQTIALAIEGRSLERPIMHDLFKNTLIKLGYIVKEVIITALENEVFFAQLILSNGVEMLKLDARPSDAIAIGLRFEAPLFINESLLVVQADDTDLTLDQIYTQQTPKASGLKKHSIEALKKLLSTAIEREDYEQAALIRDELQRRQA